MEKSQVCILWILHFLVTVVILPLFAVYTFHFLLFWGKGDYLYIFKNFIELLLVSAMLMWVGLPITIILFLLLGPIFWISRETLSYQLSVAIGILLGIPIYLVFIKYLSIDENLGTLFFTSILTCVVGAVIEKKIWEIGILGTGDAH